MEKSKVFFTDLRTRPGNNLLDKLERLVRTAGMDQIDFKNKYVAVKAHFGEPGNLAYLRPDYAAKIVNIIKAAGGKVFLTDSNTLYSGKRSNAIDHLQTAMEHGFNPLVLGCNVIIADGLKGNDQTEIEINLKHTEKALIGRAVAEADIVVSLNHFKGHELVGFGGALKNLGMGCGSRAGKKFMHTTSQPMIHKENCVACKQCVNNCAHGAVKLDENRKASIDYYICVGCGQCVAVCKFNAARPAGKSTLVAAEKITEYAYAVVKDKPSFHISFIMNVSPDCDCFSINDAAIVPDIGIAASFDPVALDKACVDMVNKAPALRNNDLMDKHGEYSEGTDKFTHIHPDTDWKAGLIHGESIGLGKQDYELVVVK